MRLMEVGTMAKVYGYCRISTAKQSIERQIRNIQAEYPDAIIIAETFTGTKIQGRAKLNKLLKVVKQGDTIVFDEVSRMSRDAEEGFELYKRLYDDGVELVFLKEHHIDTATYKNALTNGIPMTGTNVDFILEGVNKYLMSLAQEQIKLAFMQAQKEVDSLHKRTKDGMEVARMNGKQIGGVKGRTLNVKKKEPTKALIRKYSRDFDGLLTDQEAIKQIGIARNTYFKYKKELRAELAAEAEAE